MCKEVMISGTLKHGGQAKDENVQIDLTAIEPHGKGKINARVKVIKNDETSEFVDYKLLGITNVKDRRKLNDAISKALNNHRRINLTEKTHIRTRVSQLAFK